MRKLDTVFPEMPLKEKKSLSCLLEQHAGVQRPTDGISDVNAQELKGVMKVKLQIYFE